MARIGACKLFLLVGALSKKKGRNIKKNNRNAERMLEEATCRANKMGGNGATKRRTERRCQLLLATSNAEAKMQPQFYAEQ